MSIELVKWLAMLWFLIVMLGFYISYTYWDLSASLIATWIATIILAGAAVVSIWIMDYVK